MRKLFASLQLRIAALVVLPLLVVGALVIYTYFEQRDAAAAEARNSAVTLTRSTVLQEEQILESARQLLVGLAALPYIQTPGEHCNDELRELKSSLPGYVAIGSAVLDGTVVCSSLATPGAPQADIGERLYFQETLRKGALGVGEFQVGRTSGRRSLGVGYPVDGPNGLPIGVVFATLDLDWLNSLVVARLELPQGAAFTLIDRNGTIIARNPDPEPWVGETLPDAELIQHMLSEHQGTLEVPGLDGVRRLYSFSPVGNATDTGLYAASGVPTTTLAAVNRDLARNLAVLAGVGWAVIVAAGLMSRWWIVQPTQALLETTSRITRGEAGIRTSVHGDVDEIAQLAAAINDMAQAIDERDLERLYLLADLEEANRGLEGRVATRTAELSEANRAMAREIEDRKRAEAELKTYSDRLAQANQDLDDFTFVVSHDLKEPLRGIAGFNALLLEDCGDQLDETGHRYIKIINDSTVRMKALIDDLLELSRIGRIESDRRACEAGELVQEVIDELDYAIQERSGKVIVGTLPEITCDAVRFKQVISNLMTNAIKYTKDQPTIEISCNAQDGEFVFAVKDNGIGIDPRYQEKIFRVFQRLERRDDSRSTGVGLTICRKAVSSWGGRMWVESAEGKGSTFFFTLPRRQEADARRVA